MVRSYLNQKSSNCAHACDSVYSGQIVFVSACRQLQSKAYSVKMCMTPCLAFITRTQPDNHQRFDADTSASLVLSKRQWILAGCLCWILPPSASHKEGPCWEFVWPLEGSLEQQLHHLDCQPPEHSWSPRSCWSSSSSLDAPLQLPNFESGCPKSASFSNRIGLHWDWIVCRADKKQWNNCQVSVW